MDKKGIELLQTTDAREWTKGFLAVSVGKEFTENEWKGLVNAWFANAITAGEEKGKADAKVAYYKDGNLEVGFHKVENEPKAKAYQIQTSFTIPLTTVLFMSALAFLLCLLLHFVFKVLP
jgi:hypothetical protein